MGFPIRDSDMTFNWQGGNYYLNLILYRGSYTSGHFI